jgi:hypothetical protein
VLPLALQAVRLADRRSPEVAVIAVWAIVIVGVAAYLRLRVAQAFLTFSALLPLLGFLSFVVGTRVPAVDSAHALLPTPTARTPVVLLVLDELPTSSLLTRRGVVDSVRYPNFARLQRDATWYPNATTVHEHTTAAVPAILTGLMPSQGALPAYADHPDNLFTLLGATYRMNVHEEVTYLCPASLCPRESSGFSRHLLDLVADLRVAYMHRVLPTSLARELSVPEIADRWQDFDRHERFQTAVLEPAALELEGFLEGLRSRPSERALHVAHLLLPHNPWRYLPSGRQYGMTSEWLDGIQQPEGRWDDDPWLVEQGLQRHLLQVGYADSIVGRLLKQLTNSGLYDRALVVVLSDHGASFRPGELRRRVSRQNLSDIAGVPLFVKYPAQRRGRIDLRPARTVDIVPTVADVLGIELPWDADGRSLRGRPVARTRVSVGTMGGRFVRESLLRFERDVRVTVHRNWKSFGEGRESLYAIGRHRELLGAPVARRASPRGVRVAIEGAHALAHVRKASSFVPSRIFGVVVQGAIEPSVELAIAVNGHVLALTRSFRGVDGQQRFRALVPEAALREGSNDVDVFAVIGSGARQRLAHLGGTQFPPGRRP